MGKALRLLPAITVLLIMGTTGIDLSWAGEKIKTVVWETVQPKVVTALTGEVIDVKVGVGYRFIELDLLGEAALGLQWIASPKKAGARRVLKVYDLKSVQGRWDNIRADFSQDPADVAFMTKHGDAYYGTPVKWRKGFASAMQEAWDAGSGEA